MRFARPDGGVIEVSTEAFEVLQSHRQLARTDAEAGGVLLGRLIRGSHDVVIDRATTPSSMDQRSRFSFFRAKEHAQRSVDRAWAESGRSVNYLGEWHTHPEDDPRPSCIDRRDWKRIMARAKFEQVSLLFIIVGRVTTRVWEVSRHHPTPQLLEAFIDPSADEGYSPPYSPHTQTGVSRVPTNLLILRNPGPWPVPAQAVVAGLSKDRQGIHREDMEVDTGRFNDQVEQGDWDGQNRFLAEKAGEVLSRLNKLGDVELHYFGLAEIPHAIALGAYLGDERSIEIHEYDRDAKSWEWPESVQGLRTAVEGLPSGDAIEAEGSVVLRVEISFAISDNDIREVVGSKHLGEAKITLAKGLRHGICKVRSPSDLLEIRLRIREALAALRSTFPNLSTIHVFVAAPVSVCFALGQELKPRNSAPIQTYRYRKIDGRSAYTPALELSSALESAAQTPLGDDDKKRAVSLRDQWRSVLKEMDSYVNAKREQFKNAGPTRWFEMLEPKGPLSEVRPFPPLSTVVEVVRPGASVDDSPVPSEYGLTTHDNVWHLSDRLLLGFDESAGGDPETFKDLVRLFLFHESLHEHHSLTKLRAQGVGRFANCLELIDYTADAYALLHQLDSQRLRDNRLVESDIQQVEFLRKQLSLILRSYWAFEPSAPVMEWQVRRIRRYLNWYWRLAQLENTKDMRTAVRLLSQPAHVELVGIHQIIRPPRHFCNIGRRDDSTALEIAMVLENYKLHRITETADRDLEKLLRAFQDRDGDPILRFFRRVFEEARDKGGALPEF